MDRFSYIRFLNLYIFEHMPLIEDTLYIKQNVKTLVEPDNTFGLYISLFVTKEEKGIRDSNRNNDKSSFGKTVILPNGISIKPGKYQSGHLTRRAEDYLHLKDRMAGLDGESRFEETFIQSFKVDFDITNKKDLHSWEKELKAKVDHYLEERKLIVRTQEQKRRWIDNYPVLNKYDFRGKKGDWRQIDFDVNLQGYDEVVKKGKQIVSELVKNANNDLDFIN